MVVLEPRVDATRVEDMFTFQSSDIVLVHENFDAYCTILMSVFVEKKALIISTLNLPDFS